MSTRPAIQMLVAALLAGGSACAKRSPALGPVPLSGTFSFVAQTEADSAMEGRFEGTFAIENNWLSVDVPRAVITVPPGPPENWRNLTVRAFLATDFAPGAWKAQVQARPVNVFRFINFTRNQNSDRRTLPLETPLHFLVPLPPCATLETSRLAFELQWVYVIGTAADTDSRIAFSGPLPGTRIK